MLNIVKDPLSKIYEMTTIEIFNEYVESVQKETSEVFRTNNFASRIRDIEKTVMTTPENAFFYELAEKYNKQIIWENELEKREPPRSKYLIRDFVDIYNVENVTMREAMDIALDTYRNQPRVFFGVLLVDRESGARFSPLHPVLLSRILEGDYSGLDEDSRFNLSVYVINEERLVKEISETSKEEEPEYFGNIKYFHEMLDEKEDYTEEIAAIIAAASINDEYRKVIKSIDLKFNEDNQGYIEEEYSYIDSDGNQVGAVENATIYVVPAHIHNVYGIAYPGYSVVVGKNGWGANICPWKHHNISSPRIDKNISSICTHSGNSRTAAGMSSLNHSNATSELVSIDLYPGSIAWMRSCIQFSFGIYYGEMPEPKKEPEKMTKSEFMRLNPEAKLADYLAYLKETVMEEEE